MTVSKKALCCALLMLALTALLVCSASAAETSGESMPRMNSTGPIIIAGGIIAVSAFLIIGTVTLAIADAVIRHRRKKRAEARIYKELN